MPFFLLFTFLHAFRSIFITNRLRKQISVLFHLRFWDLFKVDDFLSSHHDIIIIVHRLGHLFNGLYLFDHGCSCTYLNIEVSEYVKLLDPRSLRNLSFTFLFKSVLQTL